MSFISRRRELLSSGTVKLAFSARFKEMSVMDSRFTYTGGDNGTYFDSSGVLQTSAADTARFNYMLENGVWVNKGVMIEKNRTQLFVAPRDWTDGAYVATNITAARDAVGIDNVTNSASTLTATAGNGTIFQGVTLTSLERTSSAYVKRKTGTGTIEFTDDGGATYTDITANLSSTEWYHTHIPSTQANPNVGFRIVTSGDEIEVDVGQLEDGPGSSSPILTAGATRTRDILKTTEVGWFNEAEGTFVTEHTPGDNIGSNDAVFSLNDGGASDRFLFLQTSGSRFLVIAGGVTQVAMSSQGYWSENDTMRIAASYKENNFRVSAEGEAVTTDTSGSVPSGISELNVGCAYDESSFYLFGCVGIIEYYRSSFSSNFLEAESTL